MSSSKCAEELDFGLIFEEDSGQNEGLHHHVRTPPWPTPAPPPYGQDAGSAFGAQGSPLAFHCPSIQITAIGAPNGNNDGGGGGGGSGGGHPQLGAQGRAWPRDQLYLPMDPCYRDSTFCPSPCSSLSSRSWMSDVSSCDSFSHAVNEDVDGDLRDAALRLAMGSPGGGGGGVGGGAAFGVELWQQKYQNPQNPAFSPALSPYQSPQHSPRASVTEDTWMNRCPSSRPRSRPTSPCGKRRHANADAFSRSPSPQRSASVASGASPLGSATDDAWPGPCGHSQHELDVPSKTRRTSGTQQVGDSPLEEVRGGGAPPAGEESHDSGGLAELFLQVPAHFSWTASKLGAAPLFRASSPPPLDFPLPSVFGPNRLSVEAEPRPYHRAHYETEGSRGAIKASDGGHPRVKLSGPCWRAPASLLLFMGTADERQAVRPHAFYQVHRVTGKTVSTACQEKMLDGTKVLEIHLTPDKDMTATMDCAGILKLRNADIELKKGETDVGRKNTRVRVAFRVALPRSDGWTLWLQTASLPIECSQRSGQDLPGVHEFAPGSCRREGGRRLVIRGSNLSSRSRVVFVEKSPDGRVLWETDATLVPETSSSSSLTALIPAYERDASVPVHVLFYVSNGKRRQSAQQSFTYLPGEPSKLTPPAPLRKQEPWEVGPANCHGGALRQHPGEPPWHVVEREAEDALPASLPASLPALQEITLDDVNEIIGRDACGLTGVDPSDPSDPYRQSDWDCKSADAAFRF
ncbi:nuclear factor of activated T-cells, cytoplasmic 3-like isoform X2 [Vanacampus margaritifer]